LTQPSRIHTIISRSAAMIKPSEQIGQRLTDIDHKLITEKQLADAFDVGYRRINADTGDFIEYSHELARRNPVLGSQSALGAFESLAQSGDTGKTGLALAALGMSLHWWGHDWEALNYLDEAHSTLTGTYPKLVVEWHRCLCERRLNGLQDTHLRLNDIAAQLESGGSAVAAMCCRLDNAIVNLQQDDLEKRQAFLKSAKSFFKLHNLWGDAGIALIIEARLSFDRGELEAGSQQLDEAEGYLSRANMPAMLGFCWMLRGIYFNHHRKVDQAVAWLDKAITRARALQHHYYEALALMDLAAIQYHQGKSEESYQTNQAIKAIARTLKVRLLEASATLTEANWHFNKGEYAAAQDGYVRAQAYYEQVGHQPSVGICIINQGVVARRLGHFGQSLNLLNQSLDLFEANSQYEFVATTHHNLGKTYAAFGYIEPAIKHYQLSIDTIEETGAEAQSGKTLVELALLLAERNDIEQAHAKLDQVKREAASAGMLFDLALCDQARGDILLKERKPIQALEAFQSSLEQCESLTLLDTSRNSRLGICEALIAQRRFEEAREQIEQIDPGDHPARLRWRLHLLDARIERENLNFQAALSAYVSALDEIRLARRSLDFEEYIEQFVHALEPVYFEAFEQAIELENCLEALVIAELHGNQLLGIRLGHRAAEERDLRTLPEQLTAVLNAKLGSEWTILRYAWGKNHIRLFVLTPGGLSWHKIPLDRAVQMALRLCSSPDISFRQFAFLDDPQLQPGTSGQGKSTRRQLFNSLFPEAVRQRLHPDHTLIVVPTHQLHGLPFQALIDGDTPLIEKTQVLYTHSLSTLLGTMKRSPAQPDDGRQGLILAQSEFAAEDFPALPHIEYEVAAINRKNPAISRYPTAELSRQNLRRAGQTGSLSQAKLLHIATHAYYDAETGAYTGLLLGEDVLGIEDIYNWKLQAQLVTLSACQTGMGRWYYGDEIVGITQAFLSAGARSVIASLWQVADEHAADLMAELYTRLESCGEPAKALAEAQRQASRSGLETFYWAPFSVFGQP